MASFWIYFPFSWYIARLQLINFTMANDDRKQERRREDKIDKLFYINVVLKLFVDACSITIPDYFTI